MGPARPPADPPGAPHGTGWCPKIIAFPLVNNYFTIWCSRTIVSSLVLQLFHYVVTLNHCFVLWFYCYLAIWRSKGGQGTPRAPQGVSRGSPRHPHRAPRDSSGTPRDPHKTPISALRSSPAIGIFVFSKTNDYHRSTCLKCKSRRQWPI